jgi:hypothetical protein
MQSETPSIFIGVPAFGGMIHADFASNLLGLHGKFQSAGITGMVDFVCGQSLVTHARDIAANRFLTTKCSHLLFLDADMIFNPDDILKMIASGKDLIGAPYCRKQLDWSRIKELFARGCEPSLMSSVAGGPVNVLTIGNKPLEIPDLNEPAEIAGIGLGVTLIAREVFAKLAQAHPSWRFKVPLDGGGSQTVFSFFRTEIDAENGQFFSEDYTFCKDWRRIGGKVYMLPSAFTGHVGSQVFACNLPAMKAFGFIPGVG